MKKLYFVFLLVITLGLFSGCGDQDKEQVLSDMKAGLADSSSLEAVLSLKLDIDETNGDVSVKNGIETDITMEATRTPAVIHMSAASSDPGDTDGEAELTEGYSVFDGSTLTTYAKTGDGWERSRTAVEEGYESIYAGLTDAAADLLNYQNKLKLKSDSDKVDGKDAYYLEGKMDVSAAESILSLLDMDSVATDRLKGKKVNVSFWIYKDTKLPAKLVVDMTEPMQEVYEAIMKDEAATDSETDIGTELKVNAFTVEMVYKEFNTIDTIVLPDETGEHIEDAAPEKSTTSLNDWKDFVVGEAKKFGVDLEAVFGYTEEKLDQFAEEEWESLLYEIYKEAGLYGED